MVKSLYTGVSGMKTHQQRMDVIGNNIANVNTIGNKVDVVTFKDIYYQTKRTASAPTSTLGGVNPRQVGYGVQMNTTAANMSQSGYTQSDNIYDMAINGNGFFQVMDGAGNIFYTRAGIFRIDSAGYLVNADGYHVLGISGDSEGQAPGSEIIRCVVPATDDKASSATKLINGTNVTLSMSAPSKNTNISVAFVDSEYPYATFANGILSIYFNRNNQYESEDEFENAISKAIQAGGVTLPDDCELQFDFENIPADPNSKAAANAMDGYEFSTTDASCEFEYTYQKVNTTVNSHCYMSFSVDDNENTDTIVINHIDDQTPISVEYSAADKKWTLNLNDDITYSDISEKLKSYIKDHAEATNLSITAFQFPDGSSKSDTLAMWAAQTGGTESSGATAPTTNPDGSTITAAPMQLVGAPVKSMSGSLDLKVQETGAFANDYKVTFAYLTGYDKTKAVWDDNTLTVSVCANSTVADVNAAIKEAANGNVKRLITFNNVSGLDYGCEEEVLPGATAGSYIKKTTYVNGFYKTEPCDANGVVSGSATWYDDQDQPVTGAGLDATGKPHDLPEKKEAKDIWNPGLRQEFFSGHPSINPTGGADSFFTGVAKSLSTFNLTDGRLSEAQSYDDFTDVTVQQDGRIIGLHPVHGYVEIGRIDLATFDNPNGLAKVGGTMFQETVASGEAQLGVPGTGGTGVVLSGTLEMSNVDLAEEFTNMITTQRGYQANSRVITVSDTMIEELLSLKR